MILMVKRSTVFPIGTGSNPVPMVTRAEQEEVPPGHESPRFFRQNEISRSCPSQFQDTLPYDHNRVILPRVGNDENSHYINASYVNVSPLPFRAEIVKIYRVGYGKKLTW